jgi:ribosomal protein S18 acetylase RimI-like enzyme
MVEDPRTLIYRHATLVDAEVLGQLNHQLIRDEGHRNPMSVAELTERMRNWLAHEGYEALLGFDGDAVVAYVLWRDQPDSVYLRQIYVQREYRRLGAARHLMLTLFQRWPDKRLTVDVLAGNARALAFWRRMGYQDYAVMLERLPLSGGS